MSQASFATRSRNPDVLTCIANLSSDEVFTPPELAVKMLDEVAKAWAKDHQGENIWTNSAVRFLDPCAKSGVYLREIVSRLVEGLAEKFPDLTERVDHIFANQVFGIAVTRMTSLLARRTVYCSKTANGKHSIAKKFSTESGNIWFERTEHSWVGGTEKILELNSDGEIEETKKNGRCLYCGANQKEYQRGSDFESYAYAFIHGSDGITQLREMFGDQVKFDVIIGNPPYQLSAGETSDAPIYQKFVEQAFKLDPNYVCMVTPSRWFTGGKGLDDYRKSMIEDRHLQSIVDFPDSKETFPGVEIKGGVSYFLWSQNHDGNCTISTIIKGETVSSVTRDLRDGRGVVIRDNDASSIVAKVMEVLGKEGMDSLDSQVSSQTPFGIHTNFSDWHVAQVDGDVRLFKRGLEEAWIDPKHVSAHKDWIPAVKVLMSYAYNGGDALPHQVTGRPIVVEGNSVCTQTYMVAGVFDDLVKAENFATYLRTRFVRFLIRQRKISQHNRPDTFAFVPVLPMDEVWDDKKLFKKFGITEDEQSYIESQVRAMDSGSVIEEDDGE